MDWLKYENDKYSEGYNVVCGVDEAGRGPLAGPVFAAAVILPKGKIIDGVNDSKKLSQKKREELFNIIKEEALDFNISYVNEEEIDEINILKATLKAMKLAVEGLNIKPEVALIDGNSTPELNIPAETIIKGDNLSASIACASVLAKVSRDKYMEEMSSIYPCYQFEKHKGYGTKLHIDLLKKYGLCKIHRKTFLKKILGI